MKIKYLFFVVLLNAGTMVNAQNLSQESHSVMIENQSKAGFTETVDLLSETILAKGWKVTMVHDLQETMKKNGKEVLPVKVIELCNPGHAFNILSKDEYRDVSPMLPCRVSVYQKADGLTYISRMNAPAFAGMIGGEAAKTMVQAFKEMEEILKVAIK